MNALRLKNFALEFIVCEIVAPLLRLTCVICHNWCAYQRKILSCGLQTGPMCIIYSLFILKYIFVMSKFANVCEALNY